MKYRSIIHKVSIIQKGIQAELVIFVKKNIIEVTCLHYRNILQTIIQILHFI
jgi:hypothetical protein